MSDRVEEEKLAMRYLLGTLTKEDEVAIGERFFSDEQSAEELEIAEDELLDRYVRDELSIDERTNFERVLASSPRLRERLSFAHVFATKLKTQSQPKATVELNQKPVNGDRQSWFAKLLGPTTTPKLAFAATFVFLAGTSLFLLWQWTRARTESIQLAAERARLEQRQRELEAQAADLKRQLDQLANQTPKGIPPDTPEQPEPKQPEARNVLAVVLFPGTVRSAGKSNRVELASDTTGVKITLPLPKGDYTSYQVQVVAKGGGTVFSSGALRAIKTRDGEQLTFTIPVRRLTVGTFLARVNGKSSRGEQQSVEDYQFQVTR